MSLVDYDSDGDEEDKQPMQKEEKMTGLPSASDLLKDFDNEGSEDDDALMLEPEASVSLSTMNDSTLKRKLEQTTIETTLAPVKRSGHLLPPQVHIRARPSTPTTGFVLSELKRAAAIGIKPNASRYRCAQRGRT